MIGRPAGFLYGHRFPNYGLDSCGNVGALYCIANFVPFSKTGTFKVDGDFGSFRFSNIRMHQPVMRLQSFFLNIDNGKMASDILIPYLKVLGYSSFGQYYVPY